MTRLEFFEGDLWRLQDASFDSEMEDICGNAELASHFHNGHHRG